MNAQKPTGSAHPLSKRSSAAARISGRLTGTFLVRRAAHLTAPAIKRASGYLPVKAVGGYVPKLTQKAFEKYGFSTATLVMEWAAIVGADIANATSPEKLKWPRAVSNDAEGETSGHEGAVLVLRVDPARALDISYRERQIIDRINAHFGYRAIAALRIVQVPLALTQTAPPLSLMPSSPAPQTATADSGSGTGNPLIEALGRLGDGLKHKAANPRPKPFG
jgi:hypothetical protein